MLAIKGKPDWMKKDFVDLYHFEEKNYGSDWSGAI